MNQWDESCTHLIMSKLIPTQKSVFQLLNNKYITSEDWIRKLVEFVKKTSKIGKDEILLDYTEFPDPKKYQLNNFNLYH